MRSPRLGALGVRPADLLAAALGGRPRPRLAVGAFASATAARSVSSRASRSLIFVFSALIWSNIVGVVVGMVAFSGFRSIGMINLLASNTLSRDIQP